jgi:hypothetical protein
MLLRFRSTLLVAFVTMVAAAHLGAQPMRPGAQPSRGDRTAALDTVRLVYDFEPGESVTYRVVTYDTLFFHGANSFIQSAERSHLVTYRCDSLVRDGIVLTISYGGYVARESRDTFPAALRTSHPWTNRTHTILMNDDGRRIRFLSSTEAPGVAPAGPFQPLILPYLGEPWTYVGSSQVFELNHFLLDNVAPPILSGGSVFRTVAARVDTLGVATVVLDFAETGRTKYLAENGNETQATINGESRFWYSPMLGFPVAGDLVSTASLALRAANGSEAGGRQKTHISFAMVTGDEALQIPTR